ncbi:flavodoxin family protein [Methanocella arvoryzae]|uniref:Predicted flavodoxin n=1 Tax=Methanocella arvoryzae (strain DSM 22066 / NBRC 105507 / MRE50) TaxID=351160 RepID=Q0W510_METAR|nr:flavodoxin family protein [Methanocella arvoryzae]CAJ36533.1 predicted flavodoxin [Methanocella arvoryzae MRE50]
MAHVLYYSMTGNTKKIAAAIAEELGAGAVSVKALARVPEEGLLFMGTGSYGDKPGEEMMKFIENNTFTGRKIALFGTSGSGQGKEVQVMAEALKRKGAIIIGSYYCKGKAFVVVNIGRPCKDDITAVRLFAREMAKLG